MRNALFHLIPYLDAQPQLRTALAALVLRLGLAGILLAHGLDKVLGEGNQWGANWVAQMVQSPPGTEEPTPFFTAVQLTVAWTEVLGAAALALGLFTRWVSFGVLLIQASAAYLVTQSPHFSRLKHGGYEYNLALLVMVLALLVLGGGRLALDRFFQRPPGAAAPAPAPVGAGR